MRRPLLPLLLAAACLLLQPPPVSPGASRPSGLPDGYEAVPLGEVRVTQYTHVECRSRLTASGHVLRDADQGKVCAVSRDWWRKRVKPGDLIWVTGYAQPCKALDTMALRNAKGLAQTRWIDIYVTDPIGGLAFGIRRAPAYLLVAKSR